MRYFALLITALCVVSIYAQKPYTSIGVNTSVFFPLGSKPILYRNNRAYAYSFYAERYTTNGAKYKAGIGQFITTQDELYYDTSDSPQFFRFHSQTKSIHIPLNFSYNFLQNDNSWDFFTGIGYSLFIRYYHEINGSPQEMALIRYDDRIRSDYFNYITVNVEVRYKGSKHVLLGLGTTSYHFIPVNNPNTGYPSLSVDGSLTYIF